MCGIFALLNYNEITPLIRECFKNGENRGPENSKLKIYNKNIIGFHRLAVNGLNDESDQPLNINGIILICNGEIYNFCELAKDNNISLTSDSDCEIIIHLYLLYGFEYMLNILDGVFAFMLYDTNKHICYIARDPYGVRSLYYFIDSIDNVSETDNDNENKNIKIGFASELKSLYQLCNNKTKLLQFTPGSYTEINCGNDKVTNYSIIKQNVKYTTFPCRKNLYLSATMYLLNTEIYENLNNAVRKRVEGTTDRPIACLLSGGLDSSLICALVNQYYKNIDHRLETYSIGLHNSEDLKYARIVATHLNTDHHEIIVSEEDFFNAIPEVINAIESYDTTTVRASVGNYLVAKYIKEHSEAKVIFNGDGADELMGGYLYFHKAPNANEFDKECQRLLNDIYAFDVLRSDKSISSNGLEPRTPFLDRKWVEFYLSISKDIRYHSGNSQCEKFLIRHAIHEIDPQLLPEAVLWRTKEAFSDGVSGLDRSWFTIINENIEKLCTNNNKLEQLLKYNITVYRKLRLHNPPTTIEQSYYRYLYNKNYYGTDHIIPYFWMPKYVNAQDSSARTLKIYNELTE